jgi:type IV secretion system protein VirD4
MTYHSDHAHGSARFAEAQEIARAGLLKPGGLNFGAYRGRTLVHQQRTAVLLKGGAGSGKTTCILMPMLLSTTTNVVMIDLKAELTQIIMDGLAHVLAKLYAFNPFKMLGLPCHKVSLLSHLKPGSIYLTGDSGRVWLTILPDISGSNNRFFELKGREWGDAVTRALVHQRGRVSLASLYAIFCLIRVDWEAFLDWASDAIAASPPDIESILSEMIDMNTGEAKTFDSVLSGITNALAFMADPALRECLVDDDEADFRLSDLVARDGQVFFSIMLPPELLAVYAPLVRLMLSCIRTVKQRAPEANPLLMVIDEAAALGPFKELADLPAIGRGPGLIPVLTYQDDGQIALNLGPHGATTLSANAGIELYLGGGIRDLTTATTVSRRLGNATITLTDTLTQARGDFARREAIRKVAFEGVDPIRAAHELRRSQIEAQHERKQSRALMEPSEVLGLPGTNTLVFAGGYELPPFIAEKRPYFLNRAFAGRFFPNVYAGQGQDSIRVPTFWGLRRRRVIEEPVPAALAHLPQYQDGRPLRFIEGFRPRV